MGTSKQLIIHYSEIGTKGKNRDWFEKKLMDNLRTALKGKVEKIYRRYGRIIGELKNETGTLEQLKLFPGISHFALGEKATLNLEKIKKQAYQILKEKKFNSFKVVTKRSNKDFPLKSPDVNREVGKFLEEKLNTKADYQNPEKIIYLEIGEKECFIYTDKHQGIGGLPIGTAGKVISSLSGGIDSPVASYLLMKRGCQVIFAHVYNQTQTKESVLEKLAELTKRLSEIQLKGKLYILPFEKIQKEIILNVPSKLRMVIYRRFMMKIINQIAQKEKALGIVTGDSVGQVASQTLENINCIYEAAALPVFAPLIGMNKEEIVDLAKIIKTYQISIQPYPDCCSYMIAAHPETKAKLDEVKRIEQSIPNKENLISESIKKAEVKVF